MAAFRLIALMAGAVLVAAGLALGAESQREAVLERDTAAKSEEAGRAASGNLVPLTAIVVGVGVAIAGAAIGRGVVWALALGFLGWGLTVALQTSFPNHTSWRDGSTQGASLSINPLIHEAQGSGILFVFAMAGLAGLLLACGWLARRLLSRPPSRPVLPAYRGAVMLQTPFLAVACAGALAVVLSLRPGDAGTTPYLLYLPLVTLLCAALLVVPAIRLGQLSAAARDVRLVPVAREALPPLRRVEDVLWAALLVLTVAGAWLPALQPAALHAGLTLELDLRFASLFMTMLVVPAIPALLLRRRLEQAVGEDAPSFRFDAAIMGASLALPALATLTGKALLPWLAALAPPAFAAFRTRPGPAMVVPLLLSVVLWGYGNTLSGATNGGFLILQVEVGLLALLRLAAVTLAATTLARLLWHVGGRPVTSLAAAALLCFVILVEAPLHAWFRDDGRVLAVGSLMASFPDGIRTSLHIVAAASAAAGANAAARVLRPEWFRRRRLPAASAKPSTASSQA